MKTILSVCLFFLIVTTGFAAGIDGNWVTNMSGPDGSEMKMTFVFKMEGDKLTGVVGTPMGDSEMILKREK